MNNEEYLVKVLRQLVSVNTCNPPGNEFKAVKIIEKEFKKQKIFFKKYEKKKGRTNIVGEIGKGKPVICFAAHLDTVPPGKNWKYNPFSLTVTKKKLFGRGVEDNKGAMASLLLAAKKLKKIEKKLSGKVLIAGFADEEKGSELGAKFLLEKGLLKADFAVIPDIGMPMNVYSAGEKALLHLKIICKGKQAHGSTPEKGVNAVLACSMTALKLSKIGFGKPGKGFSGNTVNIGAITGGNAPNMIPGKSELLVDIRFSGKTTKSQIIKKIKKECREIEKKTKAKLSVKILHFSPCYKLKKNQFIELFEKTVKQISGRKPRQITLNGTTIAKDFNLHKIPAVGFGIGNRQAHKSNEYIETKKLLDYSEFITNFCSHLLKQKGYS